MMNVMAETRRLTPLADGQCELQPHHIKEDYASEKMVQERTLFSNIF